TPQQRTTRVLVWPRHRVSCIPWWSPRLTTAGGIAGGRRLQVVPGLDEDAAWAWGCSAADDVVTMSSRALKAMVTVPSTIARHAGCTGRSGTMPSQDRPAAQGGAPAADGAPPSGRTLPGKR